MAKIITTKTKGDYLEETCYWGVNYTKVEIPEGLDDSIVDTFHLNPNIPKIGIETWDSMVTMYFDYAKAGSSLEAHTLLYLHPDTKNWYILVPTQTVSGGSVHVEKYDKLIDILSGQKILYTETDEYGLEWAGTSHSHNTMPLDDFSAIDDADELKMSGIHILVSTINLVTNHYKITASLVNKGVRYYVDPECLIQDINHHKIERAAKYTNWRKTNPSPITEVETFYISLATPYDKKVNDQVQMITYNIDKNSKSVIQHKSIVDTNEATAHMDYYSTTRKSRSQRLQEEEERFYLDPYHECHDPIEVSKFVESEFNKQAKKQTYAHDYYSLYHEQDSYLEYINGGVDDNDYSTDYLDIYIDELLQMGYTLKEIIKRVNEFAVSEEEQTNLDELAAATKLANDFAVKTTQSANQANKR